MKEKLMFVLIYGGSAVVSIFVCIQLAKFAQWLVSGSG